MAYLPKDRLFETLLRVQQIKSEHGWHPADIDALFYGFRSGVDFGLIYIESGFQSYNDEVVEVVKHLDDSWGLARVTEGVEDLIKNGFKLSTAVFVEPIYGSGKSKEYYYEGFDSGYLWIVDLLNAILSYEIVNKPDAVKLVRKYVDQLNVSKLYFK